MMEEIGTRTTTSQHQSYVKFIKRGQNYWGPLQGIFITCHLKILEWFDFVEQEPTYNESIIKFMIRYLFVILRRSSMHGTYHATELKRHPCEVFFWLFLLCTAGLSSFLAVNIFWFRYYFHPMVVSIERDYMNWNVTFPSLTLCETKKLNKTALYDYVFDSPIQDRKGLVNFIQQLSNLTYDNMDKLPEFPEISPNEYVDILNEVTNRNTVTDVLTGNNDTISFQRVLTEMGMCYTFNSKIVKYITPEYLQGYDMPYSNTEYTVTIFDAEKVAFLRDLKDCCEIYIHNPTDVPSVGRKLKIDKEQNSFTIIKFSATPIAAGNSVRVLFINQRKCRFMDESNLPHFPVYTKSLCYVECKIKAMLDICRCLPFFYKKLEDEMYCSVKGLRCIGHNIKKINQITSQCNCYNNCEDTKFTLEESTSVYFPMHSAIRWELSNTKIRLRRNVIFGYLDAIIGTGNVCSLFLGISVLSVVEAFFVYFIHMPIKCLEKRKRPQKNKQNVSEKTT